MKFKAVIAILGTILFISSSTFAFFIFPNYLYFAPDRTESKHAQVNMWQFSETGGAWDNFSALSITDFINFQFGKNERILHNKIVREPSGELVPNTEFYTHITPQAREMKFTRFDAGYFTLPWHLSKDQMVRIGIVKNDGTPEGEEVLIDVGNYTVVREEELLGHKCWVWHYEAKNKPIHYVGREVFADISNYYWYSEKYQITVKAQTSFIIKMRFGDLLKTVSTEAGAPSEIGDLQGAVNSVINQGYPVDDNTLVKVYQIDYTMMDNSVRDTIGQGKLAYLAQYAIIPGVSYFVAAIPIAIILIVHHIKSKKKLAPQEQTGHGKEQ
ncbi:MAG: hypothetical protein PHH26_01085 [Candidatus Thermoplasmatota archaeon]|nr:hypothetical protein [Candidatus Thermoplasmatota archaeon]